MSLSAKSIGVTKVVDPRVDFPEWKLPVREGASNVAFLKVSASSKGASVQFDITPPNPGASVIGRDMLWYNKVVFTINNPSDPPEDPVSIVTPGLYDAPRAYPFTSCVDTATIQINNESISVNNLSEIGHVLRRFNPRSAMYKLSNFTPWFPDQGDYKQLQGSGRDVIAAASTGDVDFLRGSYTRFTVADGSTPNEAIVTLETYEPINLSPFMFGSQSPGLPYVQSLGLRFNISNFARALCHINVDTNLPLTNLSYISSDHKESALYYQSIAMPLLSSTLKPEVVLPHYRLVTNLGDKINLNANQANKATFSSPVINYPAIPSRIYVFATPIASQKNPQVSDFTARFMDGLNVQWVSKTSLMTSVQREQLYAQAVDAGLSMPWEQFDGQYRFSTGAAGVPPNVAGAGSILCIRPGTDFDIDGMVPGQAGSFQFQIAANFTNQMPNAYEFQLYVVAVLQGTLTLTSGFESYVQVGVITEADVLEATEKVHPSDIMDTYGSGWFDNIKSMIRPVVRGIHGVSSIAAKAEPVLRSVKEAIGAGVRSGGSAFSGGADFYGGAMLSKKGLAARLR
jgi:hypothetical protein